jgi:hypothetical protein
MSIAALPLPRWRQRQFIFYYRRGSLFFITVAARQRQMFSRDGHL